MCECSAQADYLPLINFDDLFVYTGSFLSISHSKSVIFHLHINKHLSYSRIIWVFIERPFNIFDIFNCGEK